MKQNFLPKLVFQIVIVTLIFSFSLCTDQPSKKQQSEIPLSQQSHSLTKNQVLEKDEEYEKKKSSVPVELIILIVISVLAVISASIFIFVVIKKVRKIKQDVNLALEKQKKEAEEMQKKQRKAKPNRMLNSRQKLSKKCEELKQQKLSQITLDVESSNSIALQISARNLQSKKIESVLQSAICSPDCSPIQEIEMFTTEEVK